MNSRHLQSFVLVHADESCLGNQNAGPSRGGAGALVERRADGVIARHDFFVSSSNTTNNQMALSGAIEILQMFGGDDAPAMTYYSDSTYLVNGATDWVHRWKRNGWRRKGGGVENLELWQVLHELDRRNPVEWKWVRGHAGHAKNEYADRLAVGAAEQQTSSDGLAESRFLDWLEGEQSTGIFRDFDADLDFSEREQQHTTMA